MSSGINFSISKMRLAKQFKSFLCILLRCLSNGNIGVLTINIVFPINRTEKDIFI